MTWKKHHSKSEEYASQAEVAFRRCDFSSSVKLYQLAAKEEEIALSMLGPTKKRTIGITAVSAVSLWFKGRDFKKAEDIANKCLGSYSLPSFAIDQLTNILKKIWEEVSWVNVIILYSQIVDIDEERGLVLLNCKLERDSSESFERIFSLTNFKEKDKLMVDQSILILEKDGEVRFLFEQVEENYFKDEEDLDISFLEDSPIFQPVEIYRIESTKR